MRGCIGTFLFMIFVGPLIFGAEFAVATSTWLLREEVYTEAFSNPDVYTSLMEIVVYPRGADGLEADSEPEFARLVSTSDLSMWQSAVQSMVSQFFAVLDGRAENITLTLPLTPLKTLLNSTNGPAFINDYARYLRTCRTGESPERPAVYAAGEMVLPMCIPPEVSREAFTSELIARIPAFVETMPNEITVPRVLTSDNVEAIQSWGLNGFSTIATAIAAMLCVFAVGFWFVGGIIAAASFKGKLMWWGGSLVLASIPVLSMGVLLMMMGSRGTEWMTVNADATTDSRLALSILDSLVTTLTRPGGNAMLLAGGIPSLFGVLLLLGGIILPAKRTDEISRDLYNNPTTSFYPHPSDGKRKNDSLPEYDDKRKNDDIIRPL